MKKLVVATAITVVLSVCQGLAQVVAAGDPDAGKVKVETCLGCHGVPAYVNTYPTYHVPKIGGQHEEYLIAALQAYRDKQRSHETMHANASSLSDEDIADIAAYLSSLK